MNKVILMGRLTRNPDVRYSTGQNPTCVARYNIAVNRRFKKDGEPDADFISCVAFGKNGEFAEKYLKQGTKVVICGRIQTGSYTNREGQRVYTTDVIVEEHDFAESKSSQNQTHSSQNPQNASNNRPNDYEQMNIDNLPASQNDGFMTVPEGIEEELPFI